MAKTVKNINLEDLVPDPDNFNRHTQKGMGLLEKSISKVGALEAITVSKDRFIISGNARHELMGRQLEGAEPIVVETDGKRPVILVRTDIKHGTKKFTEAAILANTVAKANISLDRELIQEVAVDEYGLDIEELGISKAVELTEEDLEAEQELEKKKDFYQSMLQDTLYDSDNLYDIPNLKLELAAGALIMPLKPYGADARDKKMPGTYHFYVDDYRFEGIWKQPNRVIETGCQAVVEPNLSLFDTTPLAYGLHLIYKKRWIARYYQSCGIKVYADLNVSYKFSEYNQLGIPAGYNAFFTRGYSDRLVYLENEHAIAKKISGLQVPNLVVYGGGKKVKAYCQQHSLTYVEQFMQEKIIN